MEGVERVREGSPMLWDDLLAPPILANKCPAGLIPCHHHIYAQNAAAVPHLWEITFQFSGSPWNIKNLYQGIWNPIWECLPLFPPQPDDNESTIPFHTIPTNPPGDFNKHSCWSEKNVFDIFVELMRLLIDHSHLYVVSGAVRKLLGWSRWCGGGGRIRYYRKPREMTRPLTIPLQPLKAFNTLPTSYLSILLGNWI